MILREISKEEARKEIIRLFSTGKTLYYSDIVQELRLDLELVVDICNELQEQGKIAIDAGTRPGNRARARTTGRADPCGS